LINNEHVTMIGYRVPSWHRRAMCRQSYFVGAMTSVSVMHFIFIIVECGNARYVCTLHVFACIRCSGIILTPRLPLCQISFLSRPPLLS